jgi:hypothetical protein
MSTLETTIQERKLIRSFGRHLVALCVTFREKDSQEPLPAFRAYAGTLLYIAGRHFFLTAGHILSELQEALESEKIVILSAVLADTFGSERISNFPIPFDLRGANFFFIDDAEMGLDFGVIALTPYYVGLLAANGMVAVGEENWVHQHAIEFDGYVMFGLPAEYVTDRVNIDGEGYVEATMFAVKRLDEPPDGIPVTQHPRFVGQLSAELSLTSLRGMSGGPIFGFNFTPPLRYWVVALQSTWLRDRRLVFGCPLPVLASLMTNWLREG